METRRNRRSATRKTTPSPQVRLTVSLPSGIRTEVIADTETEAELPELSDIATTRKARSASTLSSGGFAGAERVMTTHDLANRYFRKPAITFWRMDMFR